MLNFIKQVVSPQDHGCIQRLKKAPDIAPGIYKEHVQKKLKELK